MADSLSGMSRSAPGADLFRAEKVEWMVMADYIQICRALAGTRGEGILTPSLSFTVPLA